MVPDYFLGVGLIRIQLQFPEITVVPESVIRVDNTAFLKKNHIFRHASVSSTYPCQSGITVVHRRITVVNRPG